MCASSVGFIFIVKSLKSDIIKESKDTLLDVEKLINKLVKDKEYSIEEIFKEANIVKVNEIIFENVSSNILPYSDKEKANIKVSPNFYISDEEKLEGFIDLLSEIDFKQMKADDSLISYNPDSMMNIVIIDESKRVLDLGILNHKEKYSTVYLSINNENKDISDSEVYEFINKFSACMVFDYKEFEKIVDLLWNNLEEMSLNNLYEIVSLKEPIHINELIKYKYINKQSDKKEGSSIIYNINDKLVDVEYIGTSGYVEIKNITLLDNGNKKKISGYSNYEEFERLINEVGN